MRSKWFLALANTIFWNYLILKYELILKKLVPNALILLVGI